MPSRKPHVRIGARRGDHDVGEARTDRRVQQLISAKLSAAEAAGKGELFEKAQRALQSGGLTQSGELLSLFVPGRLEFLGKHTDYAGGRSLLCTIERGICMVASPRNDDRVNITDAEYDLFAAFTIREDTEPRAGHWMNYAQTVARRVAQNFPGSLRGADIAFASDLPPAAGMGSSSALIVAFFSVFAEFDELQQRDEFKSNIHTSEDLAGYLGVIENGDGFGSFAGDSGVGTLGGSEDHTAILCCKPGELSQYSFCPVRHERSFALPDDYVFVIGVSGVIADKSAAARDKFNRASLAAAVIVDLWRKATGPNDATLAAAATHSPDAPEHMQRILTEYTGGEFSSLELRDRFEQFWIESEQIIPAVGNALTRGGIEAIGEMVDSSQRNAERLLGNQVPETIYLARSARKLGAAAASAFGAGFGGSVWALVRAHEAESFRSRWAKAYRGQFPYHSRRCRFFTTRAGPAMIRV